MHTHILPCCCYEFMHVQCTHTPMGNVRAPAVTRLEAWGSRGVRHRAAWGTLTSPRPRMSPVGTRLPAAYQVPHCAIPSRSNLVGKPVGNRPVRPSDGARSGCKFYTPDWNHLVEQPHGAGQRTPNPIAVGRVVAPPRIYGRLWPAQGSVRKLAWTCPGGPHSA